MPPEGCLPGPAGGAAIVGANLVFALACDRKQIAKAIQPANPVRPLETRTVLLVPPSLNVPFHHVAPPAES